MLNQSSSQAIKRNKEKFNRLKSFVEENPNAGLCLIEAPREIWLPFHQLGNGDAVMENILCDMLGQYKEEFQGVVCAYGNVHFPTSTVGVPIAASEPMLPLKFLCDLIVFQPKVGYVYTGTIFEMTTRTTMVAHVLGTFTCNVTVPDAQQQQTVNVGDAIRLRVVSVRAHNHMMQLNSELVEVIESTEYDDLCAAPFSPFVNGRRLSAIARSQPSTSTPLVSRVSSQMNLSSLFTPSRNRIDLSQFDNDDDDTQHASTSGLGGGFRPPPNKKIKFDDDSEVNSETEESRSHQKHKKTKKKKKRKRNTSESRTFDGDSVLSLQPSEATTEVTIENGDHEISRKSKKRKHSRPSADDDAKHEISQTDVVSDSDRLVKKKRKKHKRMKEEQ